MNLRKISVASLLVLACLAAPAARAGQVFSETWTGAPLGAVPVPPSPGTASWASGLHTYSLYASGTTPPTLAITDFSGDLRLDNTAASNTQESHLTTSITACPVSRAVTIEFDAHDPTNSATSSQRCYVLVKNNITSDGYRVRFSSQNVNEEVFNVSIFNDGAEVADRKFDDEVDGPGVFGTPDTTGGTDGWHVRASFLRVGDDIKVFYAVTGIGATPNLVAPNSFSFTNASYAGVAGVTDDLDAADLWMRRPLGSLDNITVTSDTTPPVIVVTGSASVTLNCGDTYTEEGATATDDVEGDVSGRIGTTGTVNANAAGVYTVTYSVSDLSGNPATSARTVTVLDTVPPVVTLNGPASATVSCGQLYGDPGAGGMDACAGPLTPVVAGGVNPAVPGQYTLTYTCTDPSGNSASATRQVEVLDDCPPILITYLTPMSLTVEIGNPAIFAINASGSGTLSYQWFFDNGQETVSLLGQQTDTLEIAAVGFSAEGQYFCQVTDELDTVNSARFTLDVRNKVPVAGLPGIVAMTLAFAAAGFIGIRRPRR